MNTSRRIAIPEDVRRAVPIEAGYRCAVPTCRALLVLDLHHLIPVRDGGENSAGNLLALCPTCHALHERGKIDPEAVRAWKAMLVSLNAAFDKNAIDSLLLLSDPRKMVMNR
jgi:5-methylcytosine-specific restriction endonuclease McrA